MIKNIEYSVTFPSNQLSLQGAFALEPGSTAVIGPNGSGKTFGTIEMVRWLLFGTKALRGPSKDYKNMKSKGTFTIAGLDYTIERSVKKTTLWGQDEEILAVNTEAVNQKVIELLGYGLDVFDIVNAARQKDSDQLSKLRPAARKKLIDDIIGLGAQEQVEKDCRNEAISHRRIAEALEEQLVRVVPPVKPECYRPSQEVQAELNKLKAYLKEKAAIEKSIVAVGDMAAEPECPLASKDELESLMLLQNKYITDKAKISSLTRSIDNAFMDAERAAATTECLTNLKDRLKQTILITHKQIESTDQVVSFPFVARQR